MLLNRLIGICILPFLGQAIKYSHCVVQYKCSLIASLGDGWCTQTSWKGVDLSFCLSEYDTYKVVDNEQWGYLYNDGQIDKQCMDDIDYLFDHCYIG